MRRRDTIRYGSLTPLLDVLFILLFAALIHAAASVERARGAAEARAETTEASEPEPADEPSGDADEPGPEDLYAEARRELARDLDARRVTYARVSEGGVLLALEEAGAGGEHPASRYELEVSLLETVPDPDRGVVYLGERVPELRLCALVREHLGRDDLEGDLVIVAPKAPLSDLKFALVRGLRRDQERCMRDEGALAVVVDPHRALEQSEERSP